MEPTRPPLPPNPTEPGLPAGQPPRNAFASAKEAGNSDQANSEAQALQRERAALRIQAAAVAAQQAALLEDEARFQQRRLQLEQQEKQLASHLEEKRQQVLQLRDQVRHAQEELEQQRKTHARQVGTAANDLSRARQELEERRQRVGTERRRLLDLRRHLKQRFHRNWTAERTAQRQREEKLAGGWRQLEQEKAGLVQERLRFNGESELGRRRLQDGWHTLREAEEQFRQRHAEQREQGELLARHAAELVGAARILEESKRQWQEQCRLQEKEAQGVEARVRNHRRKILDQQQEIQRLEGIIAARAVVAGERETTGSNHPPDPAPLAALPMPIPPDLEQRACRLQEAEAEVQQRVAVLEEVSAELADQRLHLAEQWERLIRARQRWQQDHDAAAEALEALVRRLPEREEAVRIGELALRRDQAVVRRRIDEVIFLRHYLEGCQARLRSRVAEWEGAHDRLLIDVRHRETLADQRLQFVRTVNSRWQKRRQIEFSRLQASLTAAEKLRKEYTVLRDQWLRRQTFLERKDRELTEQKLALEQYRQEVLGQAADSPAAEKQLERLRRHWATLSEALERTLTREREALAAEKVRFEERQQQIEKLARDTIAREELFLGQLTSWERGRANVFLKHEQMRGQLHILSLQRQRCEQEMEELREEIERIARLLVDGNEPAAMPAIALAA